MTMERRHDIDWLRVVAIFLLLIYHIAIIFQPWAMFVGFIASKQSLTELWKPMSMLNVWRIPLLFFVSGMGVFFAMRKRNIRQLLLERTVRILIPLLFGIVAVAPLHIFVFQKYYNLPYSYYPHAGHLWFLGNIFLYVLLLSPFFRYIMKNEEGKFRTGLSRLMKTPLGPMLITLFFMLEAIIVKPQIYTLYAETWHGFFIGFLAFLFGFLLMYSGTFFWQMVLKWKWIYIGLALVLFAVRIQVFEMNSPGFLMAIESNFWIFGLFGIGYHYLNRPSAALSYFSQAAYPVYIIHMFALYAGALIFLPLALTPIIKFICITAFTFIASYTIYEFIIRRIGFIRPVFGLKMKTLSLKNRNAK